MELVSSREKKKGKGTVRTEIVIEGSLMYVGMIQSSLGKKLKEMKDDVEKIKDKEGEV